MLPRRIADPLASEERLCITEVVEELCRIGASPDAGVDMRPS